MSMLSSGHSWQNSIAEAYPAKYLGEKAGVRHVVREEGGGGNKFSDHDQ